MPRAKAPVKRRPHSKRHAKSKATSKRNMAPAISSRRTAPAFPADILIAAPAGSRNRSMTTPFLPVPAVRDVGSERLLVRNARAEASAPRAKASAAASAPETSVSEAIDESLITASATLPLSDETLLPETPPKPTDQPEAATAPPLATEPQPREGRIAATGGQPSASAVQAPTHPPLQAIPPVMPRPDTPVAALFSGQTRPSVADAGAKPLPRSAAVTTYRKNGPIDVLSYWLRTSQKSLVALFTRKKKQSLPKQAIIEINRLRLENLLLQRQIELLRSQLQVTQ